MTDAVALYNTMVTLKQYELVIARDLKTLRDDLKNGDKSVHKQFESKLKGWSKAAKNFNKAQAALELAAIKDAHERLGIQFVEPIEDAADE